MEIRNSFFNPAGRVRRKGFTAASMFVLLLVTCVMPVVGQSSSINLAANNTNVSNTEWSCDASGRSYTIKDSYTVTVTGNLDDVLAGYTFDIAPAATVEWNANLESDYDFSGSLITLTNSGTFHVMSRYITHWGTGNTINAQKDKNAIIIVDGLTDMDNGVVYAYSGDAIFTDAIGAKVTVQGYGQVGNSATSNVRPAINMAYNPGSTILLEPNVIVKDHAVVTTASDEGNGFTIQTYGNIEVSGNARVRAYGGRAINLVGLNSIATVNDEGIVEAIGPSGVAISTATTGDVANLVANASVIVNGGTVRATGDGHAIRVTGKDSKVEVNGGMVTATTGNAIRSENSNATISVTGGFVFAYGNTINGNNNVIHIVNGSAPEPVSPSVVVAWNNTISQPYLESSSQALTTNTNTESTATWGYGGATGDVTGIYYNNNGANSGFFPLNVSLTGADKYGLLFNIADGLFYLDMDGLGTLDIGDLEYTGQPTAWSWDGTSILTLHGFKWKTPAQRALTIINTTNPSNLTLTMHLGPGSDNSFVTTAGTGAIHGIGGDGLELTVDGSGALEAIAGEAMGDNGTGIAASNGLKINGGTLTAQGATNAIDIGAASVTLVPTAYTYWRSTTLPSSDPGTTVPSGTQYSYIANDLYVKIEASDNVQATVETASNLPISGTVNVDLTPPFQTAIITLYNEFVVSAGLTNEPASSWFGTSLPAGVTVTANALPGSTTTTIELTFSGIPTEGSVAEFVITIPEGVLAGTEDVLVNHNPLALFNIRGATVGNITVSGTVGESLASGITAKITLSGEPLSTSLMDEDASLWFDTNNLPSGITVKATSTSLTTIELTFSDSPGEASFSQFAITIPGSYFLSGDDLPVQPNPDARFDILPAVYTLTYYANGGTNPPPANTGNLTGTTVQLASSAGMTYGNHIFLGWTQASATTFAAVLTHIQTQTDVPQLVTDVTFGTDNINVFAVWAEDVNGNNIPDFDEQLYTVTYDINGRGGSIAPVDPDNPYLGGSTVTVLRPVSNLNGFLGWNTEPDGSGISYRPGDTFVIIADIVLYAQWSPVVRPFIQHEIFIKSDGHGTLTTDKRFAEVSDHVTVTIRPDAGYQVNEITARRATAPPYTPVMLVGEGNTRIFTMPPYDVIIEVTFTVATGMETLQSTGLKAYVSNGTLLVSGLKPGSTAKVYNILGALVYAGTFSGGELGIPLPGRGIYIVNDGATSLKVTY
ncbi:MAG: InlB B-repeat-containing protein [Tannerella sp.]|nr:InlB B-repeat-containing protein [Tannerella sp.]